MPNSFSSFVIDWNMLKKTTGSASGGLNPGAGVYIQTGAGTLLPQIYSGIGNFFHLTCEAAAYGGYAGYFGIVNTGTLADAYTVTWHRLV